VRVVLLAPPGAGKGTQGVRIADRYGLTYLSTGDIFREEVERGSDLGQKVAGYLDAGNLVPDDVVVKVVGDRILDAARGRGYVLDGFPRDLAQGEQAHAVAKEHGAVPDVVLHLDADREELMRRILARAVEQGRSDDNEDTIRNRFDVYDHETRPLLDFYERQGLLRRINGMQSIDDVSRDIFDVLDELAAG
jgi:adenylate kinase